MKRTMLTALAALLIGAAAAHAEDATVTYKSLAPDAALEMARAALEQCRKDGFQVAVVVIDRFGQPLVVLRDRYAGLGAIPIATSKAWTSVNFSRDSSEVVAAIQSGQMSAGLANAPNVLVLGGGLIVRSGGSIVGGIGVAGAPGGDKDEACAKAGIGAVQDKLDF